MIFRTLLALACAAVLTASDAIMTMYEGSYVGEILRAGRVGDRYLSIALHQMQVGMDGTKTFVDLKISGRRDTKDDRDVFVSRSVIINDGRRYLEGDVPLNSEDGEASLSVIFLEKNRVSVYVKKKIDLRMRP